jgi:hypothetical protein
MEKVRGMGGTDQLDGPTCRHRFVGDARGSAGRTRGAEPRGGVALTVFLGVDTQFS